MATLLWLALGVLAALLTWLLPPLVVVVPLVVLAITLVSVLVPRDTTSVGARIGIGFGGTWIVIFSPNVLRDPLGATGETYLLFGSGLLIAGLGMVGVVRNLLRRQRLKRPEAEPDST